MKFLVFFVLTALIGCSDTSNNQELENNKKEYLKVGKQSYLEKINEQIKQKQYREATSHLKWFFDYAAKYDSQANYGRWEFLEIWEKLNRKYPPALNALKESFQYRKEQFHQWGRIDNFDDLLEFGKILNEEKEIISIYRSWWKTRPREAKIFFDDIFTLLIKYNEIDLAEQIIGNYDRYFNEIINRYFELRSMNERINNTQENANNLFHERCSNLFLVMKAKGHEKKANEFAQKAKQVVKDIKK